MIDDVTAQPRDGIRQFLASWAWTSERVVVATVGDDGRITSASPALERLAGKPLRGSRGEELVPPAQREALRRFVCEASGEWRSSLIALAPNEDGVPRDYRLSVVRTPAQVVLVAEPLLSDVSVLNDELLSLNAELITVQREIRRRSDELAEQNERLRELDRLKDEFVSLVSHEFRTPLTSVRGYLDLLLEDADAFDPKQRRFLDVLDRNVRRLLRLVDDLLFVAQFDAGRLELALDDHVDLARVIQESAEAARPLAEEKGLRLTLRTGPTVLLRADRARLAQLMDNLLTNAIKFTPTGGDVAVDVRGGGGGAVVEVSDTGIGIPDQERERVFERFFRTARATRRAIPGSGLGLAVAKAIVESHGGTITVHGAERAGSSFRVELPAMREDRSVHSDGGL